MLIKCPRCGFSQPKDKYCAQCGVDIENFKAPEQPLFSKIIDNTFFQVAIVAILIFFIATGLMQSQKGQLSDQVSGLTKSIPLMNKKSFMSPPAVEAPAESPTSPQETLAEETTHFQAASNVESSLPSSDTNLAVTEIKDKVSRVQLKLNYFEISLQAFESLIEDSRTTGQFNSFRDYMAGILSRAHKKLTRWGKEVSLLHSESKQVERDKPLTWFLGLQSTNTENSIGLKFLINLENSNESSGATKLDLEIEKRWKILNENNTLSIQKTIYPVQFELPTGYAAFIAGILNPKSPLANEEYLASIPPFNILKSSNFRQSQSNFVIIIEIEK